MLITTKGSRVRFVATFFCAVVDGRLVSTRTIQSQPIIEIFYSDLEDRMTSSELLLSDALESELEDIAAWRVLLFACKTSRSAICNNGNTRLTLGISSSSLFSNDES